MAKIQNTFTQGKMNKDLDERLLPVGQYRDAMNIQVSTSEGSDVGTVQNILGTKTLPFLASNDDGVCLASIADEKNNQIYWLVKMHSSNNNVIARLNQSDNTVELVLVDLNNILNFSFQDNIITGINIIDDLLFFTDNKSEPKKINIKRSIQGTVDINTHTKLVVNDTVTSQDLLEEHITVIKKAPKYPPILEMKSEIADGIISGSFDQDFDSLSINNSFSVDVSLPPYATQDAFTAATSSDPAVWQNVYNLQVGDIVVFQNYNEFVPSLPLLNYVIKASITQIDNPNADSTIEFTFEIITKSPNTPVGPDINGQTRSYYMSLFTEGKNKFEFKFPRFAYRYKYEDNEYSTFSPFSEIAFLPGSFNYEPKKGYNLGMTNRLTELYIKEFVTEDQPKDVVAIDLLYKESDSNNVYVIDTLRASDPNISEDPYNNSSNAYTYQNMTNGGGRTTSTNVISIPPTSIKRDGYYKVESETIYSLLPSNQLLRPYDNVPRIATAQEIVANRLVYGNYLQGYNLSPDIDGNNYKTDLSVYLRSFSEEITKTKPHKSIKSLREYQVGVVYEDEYGRQTPILTNSKASLNVEKDTADQSTQLVAQLLNKPPSWAKGFKFYVKQTSGPYFNLAMDRFYDADDGNIWLAFPSVDRNKVDIDSYLILKKGSDTNELVEEEARYKILAISNEAPDFIKQKSHIVGQVMEDASGSLFGSIGAILGDTEFTLLQTYSGNSNYVFENSSLSNLHDIVKSKTIRFRFESASTNEVSNYYEINSIGFDPDSNGFPKSDLHFHIDKPFGTDTNFAYDSTNGRIFSTTKLVFEELKIKNSPKFDGRFFVKIYNNSTTKAEIGQPITSDTKYKKIVERKFYYLAPNHIALHSIDNATTPTVGSIDPDPAVLPSYIADYHTNGVSYYSTADPVYNSYNTGTTRQDFWYKYTAFFRVSPTLGINSRELETTTPTGFVDVWYIDGDLKEGGFPETDPNIKGTNHTNRTQTVNQTSGRGLQSYNSSNTTFLEIGFGALEPDPSKTTINYNDTNAGSGSGYVPADNTYVDGWTDGQSSIYSVGDTQSNSNYGSQAAFVDAIRAVGTKFRWKEDPTQTVYTIVNVGNSFVLRYEAPATPFTTYNDAGVVVKRPENWNRNFVLTLDKATVWNPLAPSDGQDPMNGYSPNSVQAFSNSGGPTITAVGYTIEIIQEIEEEPELSPNPAIWETEPKEQADLNIYYEASQVYPVYLDEKNISSIVRINSTVTKRNSSTSYIVQSHQGNNRIIINSISSNISNGDIIDITYGENTISFTVQNVNGNDITLSRYIHNNAFELSWFNCYSFGNGVESNRIEDQFNRVFIDNGPIASATLSDDALIVEDRRKYGLIFSGVYNSTSSVNNLNQFIQAENITKEVNPTYGSIQKLFTRRADLVTFCEDKVLKILADKTALFTADGESNVTATSDVLGQTIPFVGDYGISKNPESFAKESYRAYFTDKQRGAVLRLSMDGLTAISDAGMTDWFGDNLKSSKYLLGTYDQDKGNYNLTIHNDELAIDFKSYNIENYTLSFSEKVNGWISFKSYIPENGVSSANKYYTFYGGNIFEHHSDSADRNTFYFNGIHNNKEASVTFLLNQEPQVVKEFRTLAYDGSQSRILDTYKNNSYKNLENKDGWYTQSIETDMEKGSIPYFVEKEKKWFNYIRGVDVQYNNKTILDSSKFSVQGIGLASNVIDNNQPPPPPPPPVPVLGCTDPSALNYDPNATVDDGSCQFAPFQVFGCTDPLASNYNPNATDDDGSCVYAPPPPPPPAPALTSPTVSILNAFQNPNLFPTGEQIWVLVLEIQGSVNGTPPLNYVLEMSDDDITYVPFNNGSIPASVPPAAIPDAQAELNALLAGWSSGSAPVNLTIGYYITQTENKYFRVSVQDSELIPNTATSTSVSAMLTYTPPALPLAAAALNIQEISSGYTTSVISLDFNVATGGTPGYNYSDLQWRETDANGLTPPGGTGTFNVINATPSPNNGYTFNFNWSASNTVAYLEAEYLVTDSSGATSYATATLMINRAAAPVTPLNGGTITIQSAVILGSNLMISLLPGTAPSGGASSTYTYDAPLELFTGDSNISGSFYSAYSFNTSIAPFLAPTAFGVAPGVPYVWTIPTSLISASSYKDMYVAITVSDGTNATTAQSNITQYPE